MIRPFGGIPAPLSGTWISQSPGDVASLPAVPPPPLPSPRDTWGCQLLPVKYSWEQIRRVNSFSFLALNLSFSSLLRQIPRSVSQLPKSCVCFLCFLFVVYGLVWCGECIFFPAPFGSPKASTISENLALVIRVGIWKEAACVCSGCVRTPWLVPPSLSTWYLRVPTSLVNHIFRLLHPFLADAFVFHRLCVLLYIHVLVADSCVLSNCHFSSHNFNGFLSELNVLVSMKLSLLQPFLYS